LLIRDLGDGIPRIEELGTVSNRPEDIPAFVDALPSSGGTPDSARGSFGLAAVSKDEY